MLPQLTLRLTGGHAANPCGDGADAEERGEGREGSEGAGEEQLGKGGSAGIMPLRVSRLGSASRLGTPATKCIDGGRMDALLPHLAGKAGLHAPLAPVPAAAAVAESAGEKPDRLLPARRCAPSGMLSPSSGRASLLLLLRVVSSRLEDERLCGVLSPPPSSDMAPLSGLLSAVDDTEIWSRIDALRMPSPLPPPPPPPPPRKLCRNSNSAAPRRCVSAISSSRFCQK